jgi:hypothetical protein
MSAPSQASQGPFSEKAGLSGRLSYSCAEPEFHFPRKCVSQRCPALRNPCAHSRWCLCADDPSSPGTDPGSPVWRAGPQFLNGSGWAPGIWSGPSGEGSSSNSTWQRRAHSQVLVNFPEDAVSGRRSARKATLSLLMPFTSLRGNGGLRHRRFGPHFNVGSSRSLS